MAEILRSTLVKIEQTLKKIGLHNIKLSSKKRVSTFRDTERYHIRTNTTRTTENCYSKSNARTSSSSSGPNVSHVWWGTSNHIQSSTGLPSVPGLQQLDSTSSAAWAFHWASSLRNRGRRCWCLGATTTTAGPLLVLQCQTIHHTHCILYLFDGWA